MEQKTELSREERQAQREAKDAERCAQRLANAKKLQSAVDGWLSALEYTGGKETETTDWRLWTLGRAYLDCVDDGDTYKLLDILQTELRIDEDGNPVDEHGFPLKEFNASRVHPDDPCQSKGYQ